MEVRPHAKYLPLPTDSLKLSDSNIVNEWLTEADWWVFKFHSDAGFIDFVFIILRFVVRFNREIEWMLQLEHYR